MKEIKITFKGADWSFSRKYQVEEEMSPEELDCHIKHCEKDALSCIKISPSTTLTKVSYKE